jgi:hypothetical protein
MSSAVKAVLAALLDISMVAPRITAELHRVSAGLMLARQCKISRLQFGVVVEYTRSLTHLHSLRY